MKCKQTLKRKEKKKKTNMPLRCQACEKKNNFLGIYNILQIMLCFMVFINNPAKKTATL